ncbi:glycine receptor subunit alpha-4-like isoform X1 [Penaeus chinensis]|uniref:glycine receptor subunit alpha-4-like isoform X1 n=1 Tax=Penaeus chinensis TaxID=139456 RepID=UPI001FB6933A|nr:glycine receptor subunit alpha-4-like isoform X1 [Penaeus chinensis]XP_047476237.1 glycine receptor subunit alpha-4-like isoform X1 [Penaeus chinensis]XP_047476238.1 glycine receptor subunit alpha-4-like isoform X1 [Penaeus chinensis]XP_047476239.1 glycine receptor subunit alpha-4-like isoform X1 [Penaeus chinensis]XP_047476240.1 glycine receptor subunit alpha-4-like isoform X1 [Penaeus chinensis]XP_047476241.1 glycine receptor subunit alpha-4-like isoform X1 [Penaeus chinensis]XP_04747624
MLEISTRAAAGAEGLLALLAVATLCIMCVSPVQASEFFLESSDKQILDYLLHSSRYDKRIRPLVKDGPLSVNVSVLLLRLASPDESSLKYEVELLLHQDWIDPRLKYDDAGRHSYLSGMHHIDDIWLPDTYFIMHGEFKENLSKDKIALKIYKDGKVSYTMRKYLILSCEGNLNKFPFDDPNCTFSMESISYEKKDLEYHWLNDTGMENGSSLAKSNNFRSLNAYMISNRTLVCQEDTFFWRGDYSCLMVNLVFTRDDVFYFSTVFFPGMVLVTSSFITFWLEWNAVPARVMIGVTTMLNFFTTSNSFRESLPVVSNLNAMNVWDSVCMFFIYVSLLEFVVVNYVGRKRPKHNMAYMPGENAVIQVLIENKHRIPQAIHRIGLSLVSGWTERMRPGGPVGSSGTEVASGNRNSHELVSCANCGNSQCSHTNAPNNCPNGEDVTVTEPVEVSQVEYTFKPHKKDPPHPIRVAKSIDVISRIVFPLGYFIFLLYFFITYKGFEV